MKTLNEQYNTTRTRHTTLPLTNRHFQASHIDIPNRKFSPASRTERLSSWNQRLQSLFTRQTY